MVAKHAVRMIQKYFNIRPEDPGGARDEVSAPNVAKFFAKHFASASLGGFCEGVFHQRGIRFVGVHPLFACRTQIRPWESPPHAVVTVRNAQPLGTRVFGAESNTQCAFPSLLEVGCRNQSVITHEVSSTEAFSLDTPDSAPFGVLDGEETELRSGLILERLCACDEETANMTKEH